MLSPIDLLKALGFISTSWSYVLARIPTSTHFTRICLQTLVHSHLQKMACLLICINQQLLLFIPPLQFKSTHLCFIQCLWIQCGEWELVYAWMSMLWYIFNIFYFNGNLPNHVSMFGTVLLNQTFQWYLNQNSYSDVMPTIQCKWHSWKLKLGL